MKNIKELKLSIATIAIAISIASIIFTLGFIIDDKTKNPEAWVLHSYGNNVALYNGDKIVEVYGSIVLDTLPLDDKRQLDNGIAFPTREEAVNAIEDYDG